MLLHNITLHYIIDYSTPATHRYILQYSTVMNTFAMFLVMCLPKELPEMQLPCFASSIMEDHSPELVYGCKCLFHNGCHMLPTLKSNPNMVTFSSAADDTLKLHPHS